MIKMKIIINIIHICYREFVTVMHDKGILIFILFVPLVYPLLYSYVYTNEVVREVPVAAVNDCNSSLSRKFLRRMDASPDVYIAAHCASMTEAEELLKQQKVYGIVRVPSSFTHDLWHGIQTHIGLYCDMCSMLYYKAIMLTATNVSLDMNKDIKVESNFPATTVREEKIIRTPIEYEYVSLYNPQSGFAAFLIPPVLMLIIQQTLFLGIGMAMGDSRDKFQGSVIPFKPVYKNSVNIVLGKALFYFLLYIVMGIYMFTFVSRSFVLPQLGHYLTFLAFLIPYILACIFLAMVLSSFVYHREDCIMLFVFLSVPLLFLSGISWPGASMPKFWKCVSYLMPSTFGMNGYVRICGFRPSLTATLFPFTALCRSPTVYFFIACIMYRLEILKLAKRGRKIVNNQINNNSYEQE